MCAEDDGILGSFENREGRKRKKGAKSRLRLLGGTT